MTLTQQDYNSISQLISDRLRSVDSTLQTDEVEYNKGSESMLIAYTISAEYTTLYFGYDDCPEDELTDFSFSVDEADVYDYETDEHTTHNLDEEKLTNTIYKQLKH